MLLLLLPLLLLLLLLPPVVLSFSVQALTFPLVRCCSCVLWCWR
jgi:hypothetical protein